MEVHDAFSVCEPMALDSMGFASKEKVLKWLKRHILQKIQKLTLVEV